MQKGLVEWRSEDCVEDWIGKAIGKAKT